MRFTFTEAQEELREAVRDFLKGELQAGTFTTQSRGLIDYWSREFSLKMAERGWIGFSWPKAYWGKGRSYVDKMILNEELMKVQAPIGYHFLADRQVGPALIAFGSDWQRETFLPKIAAADEGIQFCLLFSEPNAGSDLSAVATKAVKEGDHFIINGQKIWNSGAHTADYGWLLAKTSFDEAAPKHRTCSEFIIDMKAPGVTVKPIINSAGEHSFNEVFFDNVKIGGRYLVGRENAGFKQIMAQMDYERTGMERLLQNYPIYRLLVDHIRKLKQEGDSSAFYYWARDQVAQLEIEHHIGRLLCYHTAWIIDQGKTPSSQAAMAKAFCTQHEQRVNDAATKIVGPMSQIREHAEWSPFPVDLATSYLWGPSYTLQGGSTEILKNIVALRGLGLPRS